MNIKSGLTAAVLLASLSACGGGGGGSSTPPPAPPPPPPPPRIDVSLSSNSASATVNEGATEHSVTVSATSVVTGNIATPVIPDLMYDEEIFASVEAVERGTSGTYTVTARTRPNITGGDYSSEISFRLCRQAACTQVYAGSSQKFTLNLTVKLHEWTTFQRNNQHTGYVHVNLDHTKFQKAWEWDGIGEISPAVTGDGTVIVANGNKVTKLNESSGVSIWQSYLNHKGIEWQYAGMPAINNGKIYVAAQVTYETKSIDGEANIIELDSNGNYIRSYDFISQDYTFNAPLIDGEDMFYAQGYYGGELWKYKTSSPAHIWKTGNIASYIYGGMSPATDEKNVYISTHIGVAGYNKLNGNLVYNFVDYPYQSSSSTRLISPIVIEEGLVLYLNRSDSDRYVLVNFNDFKEVWRSGVGYSQNYAIGGDKLFAYNYSHKRLDVISLNNGKVLWSWSLPEYEDYYLSGLGMAVTNNLVIISAYNGTFAIDLNTHEQVWSYPKGGVISISSNHMMYISHNHHSGDNKLIAIKLR